jgi:hypothetical protein
VRPRAASGGASSPAVPAGIVGILAGEAPPGTAAIRRLIQRKRSPFVASEADYSERAACGRSSELAASAGPTIITNAALARPV